MHSLASFDLEMIESALHGPSKHTNPNTTHLPDWIQHLPASLQSLRMANVFSKEELDWKGFYKFNQLTSLDLDHIGHHLWSDFNGLWHQIPLTLTSLTLKAEQMHPGWLSDLPDLPQLTCLSVLESTPLASVPNPGLPAILESVTSLHDKFPEWMWFKRDVRKCVLEEWILIQQYRKKLPLTFWANHPLFPDKVALQKRAQLLTSLAKHHGVALPS